MRRQPTVSDVATAAGVSRQTVSNVLNTPHIVRDETRERGEEAIATEHVLSTGARRVAFLGWPAGSGTGDDRRTGWRTTMESRTDLSAAQLDALDLAIEEDPTDGTIAARVVASIDPPPDAIVCA